MPELPDRPVDRPSFERQFNRGESHEDLIERSNASDARWMALLGGLAIGATILGAKHYKTNLFGELMNLSGRGANFVGNLNKRKTRGIIRETSDMLHRQLDIPKNAGGDATLRGFGGGRLEELSIIQDLAEARNFLYDPRNQVFRAGMNERFKRRFNDLPRSGTLERPLQHHHKDLERITVKEILDNSKRFINDVTTTGMPTRDASGKTNVLSIGILEKALETRWITEETLIDANIFKTIGQGTSERVLDLRLKSPRALIHTISDIGIDIAGVVKSTASLFGSAGGVADLGTSKLTGNRQIFLGGDVFDLGVKGIKKVATNQSLGDVGDLRFIPATLREAAKAGNLDKYIETSPSNTFLGGLQDRIGIGRKFHDKRTGFLQGMVRNIALGSRAVGKGDAVFYARKYKYAGDKPLDVLLKRDIPEAQITTSGKVAIPGKYAGYEGGVIPAHELSLYERGLAYLGMNQDIALVKTESALKDDLLQSDLYFGSTSGTYKGLENVTKTYSKTHDPVSISLSGQKQYTARATKYAASSSKVDKAYDFANWMALRLNKLASSSLLGIGFKPSASLGVNWARVGAVPLAYMLGTEAIRYTDYVTEKVTGVSPIEKAADIYTNARVIQQQIRSASGISSSAKAIEEALPGVSVGALGTVTAALTAMKAMEKTPWLPKGKPLIFGKAIAGLIYAAIGGPDVGQDPGELREEYSGDRKVPIRKARWWMMGYQPFSGGDVDHYAPSWYTKLKNKPYQTSVYGSAKNYWKHGSMLPTPSNKFGLDWLMAPYWLEKKNYYNRPYPVTGGLGENVPLIGPIISDTIGSFIKPRKVMHRSSQGHMTATSNVRMRGVSPDAASMLGIADIPNALVDVNRPDVRRDRLGKYANVALEPLGIWKFALEFFGVKFDDVRTMADASNMNSVARAFYDKNFGGMFGETELIRRFLMADYATPNNLNRQINPIYNTMPAWLPGSLSEAEKDQTWYADFHKGDPYTKISGGEYRLPGPGYESVNELHGGTTYSDVDKYLILADIAPHSAGYWKYKSRAQSAGLSPEWQRKIEIAEEQREAKLNRYDIGWNQGNIAEANKSPIIRGLSKSWTSLNENILSEIPILGSKFFPHRDPVEHYKKFEVEGESFANWNQPYGTIIRPALMDLAGEDPLTATIKGGATAYYSSAGAGAFLNPISAMRIRPGISAIAGAVGGLSLSVFRMGQTGAVQGNFVPRHIQNDRKLEEYLDNIKYAKYSTLQDIAQSRGQGGLADQFRKQVETTKAFGVASNDPEQYILSLDKNERTYFEHFVQAPHEKRSEILSIVPDHMKKMLSNVYSNKSSGGDAAANVSDYFRTHALPNDNWAGWHPSVPDAAIDIRAVQAGIGSHSDEAHRLGYFPGQIEEVGHRYPGLDFPFDDITDLTEANRRHIINSIFKPVRKTYFSRGSLGTGPEINIVNAFYEDSRKNDVFSFYNTAYR